MGEPEPKLGQQLKEPQLGNSEQHNDPQVGPSRQHEDPQPGPSGLCKGPKLWSSPHYIETDESSDPDTDILLKHQLPPGFVSIYQYYCK